MARGQAVTQVNTSARAAWAVLADHRDIANWAPGMSVEIERAGSPTDNGVGTIRVISGPGIRIREEITAFEPGLLLGYRALSGIPVPDWTGEIELAERAGRTTIRWTVTSTSALPGVGLILRAVAKTLLFALTRAIAKHAR